MAFTNNNNDFLSLSAGKVTQNGIISYVPVATAELANIVAGTAVSINTKGEQTPYDGSVYGGVNIVGSTTLGATKETDANPEVMITGTVMVKMAVGQVAPKFGERFDINANGEFLIDESGTQGFFTGQTGRINSDTSLTAEAIITGV